MNVTCNMKLFISGQVGSLHEPLLKSQKEQSSMFMTCKASPWHCTFSDIFHPIAFEIIPDKLKTLERNDETLAFKYVVALMPYEFLQCLKFLQAISAFLAKRRSLAVMVFPRRLI